MTPAGKSAANETSPAIRADADRWLIWPAVATVAIVASAVLACKIPSPINLLVMFASLAAFWVGGISLVLVAVVFAVQKKPRHAASIFAAAVISLLLWRPILFATDYIHLALTAGFGLGQINDVPAPTAGGFRAYDWSVGFAGSNTFLIRDDTDEIALPPKLHRHPLSDEQGFGEDCAGKSDHLLGHFYICSF